MSMFEGSKEGQMPRPVGLLLAREGHVLGQDDGKMGGGL